MSDPTFLGIEQSVTGRRWTGPSPEVERHSEAITQLTDLPLIVARVLARSGVSPDAAQEYLAPSLRSTMPDPRSLRDMEVAAGRFLQAVRHGQPIAIFADYDVDGGSSAALLVNWLRALAKSATVYVPDRIDEGYGPNDEAMTALAKAHDLIICVDCGTLSHGPIAAAKSAGADVLVLDHHLGAETLPPADAVVNPNRQDEDGALGHLCAAGVVFLFLAEANRQMRDDGGKPPDLLSLLDLVALATVADVAPLIGFNRALVRQGLTVMARRTRPGLVALSDAAQLRSAPTAYHLGYLLGPRVNAGGRIGAADMGARLLSTDDPHEAAALAEKLDHLNRERREIEAQVLADAIAQSDARGTDGPLVWAAGEGWHPGVVGIVASRLKEAYNRPAIVIGLDGDEGKGSGRSVTGIDLGACVARCASEGLLLKGGGHKMAAGLTVAADRLDEAMERLGALLGKQGAADRGPKDLRLDGVLACGAATPDLITALETAGPFGAGAPAPRIALSGVQVTFAKPAGESHLRLTLGDDTGRLEAICFRAFEGELGSFLSSRQGQAISVAGRLQIDDWGGRLKAKLQLEDAAPSA